MLTSLALLAQDGRPRYVLRWPLSIYTWTGFSASEIGCAGWDERDSRSGSRTLGTAEPSVSSSPLRGRDCIAEPSGSAGAKHGSFRPV